MLKRFRSAPIAPMIVPEETAPTPLLSALAVDELAGLLARDELLDLLLPDGREGRERIELPLERQELALVVAPGLLAAPRRLELRALEVEGIGERERAAARLPVAQLGAKRCRPTRRPLRS
jgi:hypothetical protein